MVEKKTVDSGGGVRLPPAVPACPATRPRALRLTNGAACDPDPMLGELADWPADLLALVREGLSLSPAGLPVAARALALAVAKRFAEGRPDDPAPLVVRIGKEDLRGCDPSEIDRVLAFTRRVHTLPAERRPVFSFVLRECAEMLSVHRAAHGARPQAECPFCTGVLPIGPSEVAS